MLGGRLRWRLKREGLCVLLLCSCVSLLFPCGLQPARPLCPWQFPGKNTGVDFHFPLQGNLPGSGIEPMSTALASRLFPTEPPGKPKNIEVGSLSLLQGNLPTKESNQGPLYCKKINSLAIQGSPYVCVCVCVYIHTHTHIHTYMQLIYAVVQQKLTQHCKAVIFQKEKVLNNKMMVDKIKNLNQYVRNISYILCI